MQHYPPAADITEATRFFTTAEIRLAILELFPTATIHHFDISLFLKENGYRYTALPDKFNVSFKWMVK